MRRSLLVSTFGFVLFASGCAAIYQLDDYSTSDTHENGGSPTTALADAGGTVTATPASQAPGEMGCQTNADCRTMAVTSAGEGDGDAGLGAGICVKTTAKCAPLATADCPHVYGDPSNDDAIVLGTILGGDDSTAALERAALLAAEEVNSQAAGGGLPPSSLHAGARPLVVVACSATDGAVRAARHLVDDLHVPAIVGPTTAEAVVDVTQQVSAKGHTLVLTPTSVASAISNLADDDLTWRGVPSDNQRAKLVIGQINDLETVLRTTRSVTSVKLGVVHCNDALGTSARDSISGKLIINGRFMSDAANASNVSVDAYAPGDAASLSAIATKYTGTFKPDIVFITAAEQLTGVVVALEQALTAARATYRPYYVLTDGAKTAALLETLASGALPSDIRRRIRGVGIKPDAASGPVLSAFTAAFTQRYGVAPNASTATAYDAMYAIAYAIAATPDEPVSGTSVAHGLRALGVGPSFSVGIKDVSQVLQNVSAGKSVTLRGTFGLLQWDTSGDIAAGTAEVWCVGGSAGAPTFGSSGLTMNVQTQVVGGAFVQCQ